MVVGWQISESLRSDLAIDALEMAVWNRTRHGQVLDGLVHHSDRGVQYLSIRYSERLDENDIVASVGSRGDSYDNAMAEAFNSLYKWELIYPQGPWRGLDDVEYATLGYIDWFNHRRLHGEITEDNSYVTPAEFEATYYRQIQPARGGYPITRAVMEPGAVQTHPRLALSDETASVLTLQWNNGARLEGGRVIGDRRPKVRRRYSAHGPTPVIRSTLMCVM